MARTDTAYDHKLVCAQPPLRVQVFCVSRGDLFGSLLRQEVAFFDKEEVGVLTSRLGSDCQAVVRALSTNINVALRNALQAIGRLCTTWSVSTSYPPAA